MDKIRDEMAKSKDGMIRFLGEGVTALVQLYPGTEPLIEAEGKSLKGCLGEIRKAARGGVADPIASTEAICKYYGLDFKDYRRLAAEINLALCGEAPVPAAASQTTVPQTEAPQAHADDFDLDALLGVL